MARGNNNNNSSAPRRAYDRVSANEEAEETTATTTAETELTTNNNNRRLLQRGTDNSRSRRRPYSRVSLQEEDEEHTAGSEATTTTTNNSDREALTDPNKQLSSSSEQQKSGAPSDNVEDGISITILDFTQKKFSVRVSPSSTTVARLKSRGCEIHKVPVHLQRLIFRGKLLVDAKTLKESGIVEEGAIIHLFPKPRVVISDSSSSDCGAAAAAAAATAGDDDNEDDDGGARVPTIVLDASEAEQRTQILVLGSADYVEAQNNVKLFSFMLLIISSIELLNLLAIAMGVPQEDEEGSNYFETDDIFPSTDDYSTNAPTMAPNNSNSTGHYNPSNPLMYPTWGWPNTIDLIISIAGVYVAVMGIQATTENTLRLARIYVVGTFLVGVSWLLFNYFVTVQIDEAVEHDHQERDDDYVPDMTDSDIYKQAMSVMVLPGMVWLMCCMRAMQFHHLLREAEQEAEQRIQSELARSSNEEAPPPPPSDAPEIV